MSDPWKRSKGGGKGELGAVWLAVGVSLSIAIGSAFLAQKSGLL